MALQEKRIAIVCFSSSLGGLELSSFNIAETMQSKGVKTLLVVPPSSPLVARAAAAGVETAAMMPRWKYFDFAAALKFSLLLKAHRIDTVMLMRSQDINLAAFATLFVPGIKLVFYQQMRSRHNKRDPMHTWIYSKLSLWISLTEGMRDDVLDCTRVPREKAIVVRLGTDLRRFDPSLYPSADARTHFDLPADKRIVAVLGRLDPGKGQEVLIRAIPDIVKEHEDMLFLIAGDETAGEPGYKKRLETLCAELGVGSRVRFMKFTDDVPRLMAAMDVLVLPSFSETFGLVLIEAMAMGKTIVATNAGGVPEIITHEKNGLLVEPRDSVSLGNAIRRVLDDPELARSMAEEGKREAQERYDFGACVDSLLNAVSGL